MKKILMRMGKSPFDVKTPEETLEKNLLGTNIGNALFQVASHKLLTTNNSKVYPYKFTPSIKDIEWANNNFDVFVIPLANAFRLSFKGALDKHTEFIKKLNIPVVILGVGVQAQLNCDNFSHLEPIKKNVKNFCDAVLKKSPSIGVRGECTKKYLLSLGYNDSEIDIIGCPSMFWYGKDIFANKKLPRLYKNSKISFNLSPYAKKSEVLLDKTINAYNNVIYIPQNNTDLEQLLYGPKKATKTVDKLILNHFYKKNKIMFFIEPKKWLDYLKTRDFSIGTRIHGTIASIIAGTPAHLFVHDSRTKELADYFEIPYSSIDNIENIEISQLYESSDYTGLIQNHEKRFQTMLKFLEKHNLEHIFEEKYKGTLIDYEEKYYTTAFAPNVKPIDYTSKDTLVKRVSFLHKELKKCQKS